MIARLFRSAGELAASHFARERCEYCGRRCGDTCLAAVRMSSLADLVEQVAADAEQFTRCAIAWRMAAIALERFEGGHRVDCSYAIAAEPRPACFAFVADADRPACSCGVVEARELFKVARELEAEIK